MGPGRPGRATAVPRPRRILDSAAPLPPCRPGDGPPRTTVTSADTSAGGHDDSGVLRFTRLRSGAPAAAVRRGPLRLPADPVRAGADRLRPGADRGGVRAVLPARGPAPPERAGVRAG